MKSDQEHAEVWNEEKSTATPTTAIPKDSSESATPTWPKQLAAPLGLSEWECSNGDVFYQRSMAEARQRGLDRAALASASKPVTCDQGITATPENCPASLNESESLSQSADAGVVAKKIVADFWEATSLHVHPTFSDSLVAAIASALTTTRQQADERFDAHTKAVGAFLSEMAEIYSLDALEPAPTTVREVTEALLRVSREIREEMSARQQATAEIETRDKDQGE